MQNKAQIYVANIAKAKIVYNKNASLIFQCFNHFPKFSATNRNTEKLR